MKKVFFLYLSLLVLLVSCAYLPEGEMEKYGVTPESVESVGEGVENVSTWLPGLPGTIGTAVGGVLTILAGAWGESQRRRKKKSESAAKSITDGVDEAKKKLDEKSKGTLVKALRDIQTQRGTEFEVKRIREEKNEGS